MKKLLLAGLLTGAMVMGAGCKTMGATRDTNPDRIEPPPPPAMGGAGLDPNPDHNVVNGPGVGP